VGLRLAGVRVRFAKASRTDGTLLPDASNAAFGRTRARTWDPLIKSSTPSLLRSFQIHAALRHAFEKPFVYRLFSHNFALRRTQTFQLLNPPTPFENRFGGRGLSS
jgi:hypothetical protein